MRIVLDTSILTSAISGPLGPAGETLYRIRPPHLLILSTSMLSELSRVLGYERVRRLHELDDEGVNQFLTQLETTALIVTPNHVPRVVPGDPDDDQVVAAALAGSADMICTRDRHFSNGDVLDYCRRRAIPIVNDVELLHLLRAKPE